MSLTIFYGLLTLLPLALGVALAALGLARRAMPVVGVALAVAGVILPVAGLAWMAAEVSAGYPLEIALWGGSSAWLAIYARADALSVYAGLGVAALITPLLLWVAWRAAPPESVAADEPTALEPAAEAETAEAETAEAETAEAETAEAETAETPETPETAGAGRRSMERWQWAGVALTLGLESLLLSLVFAENIGWLALTWILVIGVSWALGELGSNPQTLDWKGLALMATPPLIWLLTTMLIAGPAGARRLIDLMGLAKFPPGHVFVMTLAIALAAGSWPALGWMRKRASITAPAGLGAVMLVVMPAALFVGARTLGIAQTASGAWPGFALGIPPITVGTILALFGAATLLLAGLLALGRRDGRGLIASCALAVAGWGLLGLGVGSPLAELGVTLLLTTSTLGLGAMLAALVASGAVTADIEPDSAGPRVFGATARPAALFAWVVGAATVVGLPLFAGFAPAQMISAAALPGPRVAIPLVGLAWGGAALLLIGLLRATAPAFTAFNTFTALSAPPAAPEESEEGATAGNQDAGAAEDTEAEAEDEAEVEMVSAPELQAADLPGVALGTLALIAGLAPSALLLIGSIPAAESFLQSSALNGATQAQVAGYTAGASQWLSTPAVVTLVVVALALGVIRWRLPRATSPAPLYRSGQLPEDARDGESEELEELAGLPEPAETWDDLLPALRSEWMTPGASWLGIADETEETEENGEAEELSDSEADEDGEDEESESAGEAPVAEEAEEAAEAPEELSSDADDQGARKAHGAKRGKQ